MPAPKQMSETEVLALAKRMEELRGKLVRTGRLTRAQDEEYTAAIQRWDSDPRSHGRSWARIAQGKE